MSVMMDGWLLPGLVGATYLVWGVLAWRKRSPSRPKFTESET